MTTSHPALATFVDRHVGPRAADVPRMLEAIGVGSLEDLVDRALPHGVASDRPFDPRGPRPRRWRASTRSPRATPGART